MKRRLLVLALLGFLALAPACTLYGERPVINHWADATGGQGLERSFWEDVKNKSWNDLSGHIAANYIAVTPAGKMDQAAALENLQHFDLKNYSLGNVQTELHGNTFVVTYELTLEGKFNDKPLPSEAVRMMTVWQQQRRGWVAIARSELGTLAQ